MRRARVLRRTRVLRRWWRRRSRLQARAGMAAVATVALLCGVGFGALVLPGGRPGPAPTAAPEGTPLGPVTVVLPEDLGPWVAVPAARMEEVREAASGGGLVLDGAWGAVAPGDVVVTVMTAPAGAHAGVASVTGPFSAGRLDPPWPGPAPHRAGVHVADGVREGVLALEAPDGHLVILSVSGPSDALDAAVAGATLRTVRVRPGD